MTQITIKSVNRYESFLHIHGQAVRVVGGILGTRVQVITVNVGAAVAAADAAEGGDRVSVAVTVAEKRKAGKLLKEN